MQDYDRLVETGFSDPQARVLLDMHASASDVSPQIVSTLELIVHRLDEHSVMLVQLGEGMKGLDQRLQGVEDRVGRLEDRFGRLDDRVERLEGGVGRLEDHAGVLGHRMNGVEVRLTNLEKRVGHVEFEVVSFKSQLNIIDERMKSESRVHPMVNTTLIAMSAIMGGLLAVFVR